MSMPNVARQPDFLIGPDGYPYQTDDPYADGHRLLDAYLLASYRPYPWNGPTPCDGTRAAILTAAPHVQVTIVHALMDRLCWLSAQSRGRIDRAELPRLLGSLAHALLARSLPLDCLDLVHVLRTALSCADLSWQPWRAIVRGIERYAVDHGLDGVLRPHVWRLRGALHTHPHAAAYRILVLRLDEALGIAQPGLPEPGEPWADLMVATLAALDADERTAWDALLRHLPVTNSANPPETWRLQARRHLDAVGTVEFTRLVLPWLALAARYAPGPLSTRNTIVLKNLIWYCALLTDEGIHMAVADLTASMFRAAHTATSRSRQVGKAGVAALQATGANDTSARLC